MIDAMRVNLDAVLARRPHFKRRNDEIYFLASKNPTPALTEIELKIWDLLETDRTIADLRLLLHHSLDPHINRLIQNQILEILPPAPPHVRKKIMVFEPHSDDAALSVGGTMLKMMNQCEFTIVTLASRSNFTSYYYSNRDYFETEKITKLRLEESSLFARSVNGRHHNLNLNEAVLRYFDGNWSHEWFKENRGSVSAFQSHRYSAQELEKWINTVYSCLQNGEFDEVWIPAGIGEHVDHALTRDASLQAIARYSPTIDIVKMYEDVPYAWRRPEHEQAVLDCMEKFDGKLVPSCVSIDEVFERKMRGLSIYASQFKVTAIKQSVTENAKMAAARCGLTGKFAEQFWRVEKMPAAMNRNRTYYDRKGLDKLKKGFNSWISQNQPSRIRLLLLMEPGRWQDDAGELKKHFPNTKFEIFAAIGSAGEMSKLESAEFMIKYVARGPRPWLGLALKLALSRPLPTIFISGTNRVKEANWISWLWPMSETIVLPTLDHFMILLEENLEPS